MGFFRPEARAPLLGTRSQISLCVQARATPPRWGREGVGRKTWQMALSVSLPLLPLPFLLSLTLLAFLLDLCGLLLGGGGGEVGEFEG